MSTQPTEADWADFAAWSDRDLTALREGIAARDERIEKLRDALAETAQSLAWLSFGECRGFSENLLTSKQAIELARKALDETGG